MSLVHDLDTFCKEEILCTLIERSSDSIFLIKEDSFLFMNSRGGEYLGLSSRDLKGRKIKNILPQEILSSLDDLHKGEGERRFTMEDGLGRTLSVIVELFLSKEGDTLYLLQLREETSYQKVSRALAQSKRNYREIVESMEDGYYEVDLKGNFTYLNRSLCDILGFKYPEGLGVNYRQFYKNPEIVFEAFNKVYRTGKPEKGFGWTIITSKGEERFVEVSISLMTDGEGNPKGFSGVARDSTERKETERKLLYLTRKDTLTDLNNRYHFEEEMNRLKERGLNEVTIFAFDIDGLKFINDTLGHEKGDMLLKYSARIISSSFRTDDLVARIGGDEFAALLPSYSTGLIRRISRRLKERVAEHNRNSPQLPIYISTGVSGIKDQEIDLEEVLRQADDEMYRKKEKNKMRIKLMILDHFLCSLERKDFLKKGHEERVRDISLAIARRMNLSPVFCELLTLLATYHDLGKVGICDSILFKESPLTCIEYETVKRHVEMGYRIVNHFSNLKALAPAILDHHQWWNGQGYPGKKRGEEIHILARVFMVADTLDSLTGYRPYRKPIPLLEALKIIEKGAGRQFDPYVVKILLEALPRDGSLSSL